MQRDFTDIQYGPGPESQYAVTGQPQPALPGPEQGIYESLSPILLHFKDSQAVPASNPDRRLRYFTGDNAGKTSDQIAAEELAPVQVQGAPLDMTGLQGLQTQIGAVTERMQGRKLPAQTQAQMPDFATLLPYIVAAFQNRNKAFEILSVPFLGAQQQAKEQDQRNLADFQTQGKQDQDVLQALRDMLSPMAQTAIASQREANDIATFNADKQYDANKTTFVQNSLTGRQQSAETGRNYRAEIGADSKERTALLKEAFGADSPEARVSAATTLKTRYGLDVYDSGSLGTLTPKEKVDVERAKSLAEKRPFEIQEIQARTGVSRERAALLHKQVENFDETMRIKLAMLGAYLDNVDSMIRDREADRSVKQQEDFDKKFEAETKKVQDEIDGLQKDYTKKREEFDKAQAILDSKDYESDTERDYYQRRFDQLYNELSQLLDKINEAKGRLKTAQEGFAPMNLEPGGSATYPNGVGTVTATPQGKVSGKIGKSRRGRSLKADLGPFAGVV